VVDIRFTVAAARHRISRGAVRYVMATTEPMEARTKAGDPAWLYVGRDERGRRLEVIAVEIAAQRGSAPYLLVIHVMQQRERR
jgi:hypothetical protein